MYLSAVDISLDLTQTISYNSTTPLIKVQNHHLYAINVASKHNTPHAFTAGGCWANLLNSQNPDRRALELRQSFGLARHSAIPQRVVEAVYRLHMGVQQVRRHMPGNGECPTCRAQQHHVQDDPEHRMLHCPLSAIVLHVL